MGIKLRHKGSFNDALANELKQKIVELIESDKYKDVPVSILRNIKVIDDDNYILDIDVDYFYMCESILVDRYRRYNVKNGEKIKDIDNGGD